VDDQITASRHGCRSVLEGLATDTTVWTEYRAAIAAEQLSGAKTRRSMRVSAPQSCRPGAISGPDGNVSEWRGRSLRSRRIPHTIPERDDVLAGRAQLRDRYHATVTIASIMIWPRVKPDQARP
jgi:hypothetical protein